MQRAAAATLSLAILVPNLARLAQAQDARAAGDIPRFEVASVRPHRAADDVIFALQFQEGGRLTATGTLRMLIRTAYRLQEFQVVGPGGWIDDEQFEIDGRARREATPDEMRLMLRALWRERFGLMMRSEQRDAPVYALRVAKPVTSGRARPAAEECSGACNIRFAPGVLSARGVTMRMVASELSWWVDRSVTDQTALRDKYDLDLEWAPDHVPQAPNALSTFDAPVASRANPDMPSIFTAIREQLGLSLEPERGDVEILVIDRAGRPAAD